MVARNRTRTRRLAAAGLAVVALPVGVAHLAVNAVPVTHAGSVQQPISFATTLVLEDAKVNVAHAGEYQFLAMRASLSAPSGPIGGATLVFRVAGVTVCTATTNNSGHTNCPSSERFPGDAFEPVGADPLTYPYTVAFAGSGSLAASTASGHLSATVGNGHAIADPAPKPSGN